MGVSGSSTGGIVDHAYGVRPVITLSADAEMLEGTGTYADPFVVGEKIERNNTLYNY